MTLIYKLDQDILKKVQFYHTQFCIPKISCLGQGLQILSITDRQTATQTHTDRFN